MEGTKVYVFSHPYGEPELNDDGEYEAFSGAGVSDDEIKALVLDDDFRKRIMMWCDEEKCHRVVVSLEGQPEGLQGSGHCVGFFKEDE